MPKYTLKTVFHIMADGKCILSTDNETQAQDILRRLNNATSANDNAISNNSLPIVDGK